MASLTSTRVVLILTVVLLITSASLVASAAVENGRQLLEERSVGYRQRAVRKSRALHMSCFLQCGETVGNTESPEYEKCRTDCPDS